VDVRQKPRQPARSEGKDHSIKTAAVGWSGKRRRRAYRRRLDAARGETPTRAAD
jgi:hypothetical protein